MDKQLLADAIKLIRTILKEELGKVTQSIEDTNKTSQEAILSLSKKDRTDEVIEAIESLDKEEKDDTELLEKLEDIVTSVDNLELNVEGAKIDIDTEGILKGLSQVSSDIKSLKLPKSVDNRDVLVEIANKIEKTDLSNLESLIKGIKLEVNMPDTMDVNLDPNLIEDKRVKVSLPVEQVNAMSQIVDQGGANGANLSNKLDINTNKLKDIEENQVDGSQTTSIVDPDDPTRKGEFDNKFKVPIAIDIAHHEMHEGDHYFFKSYIVNVGGAGSATVFAFTTPNTLKRIHAKAMLTPDVDFTVELHEGATITGGTPVEGFNNERDSVNEAELDAVSEPTITTPGNIIWSARNGGGKNPVGVSPGFNYEIIAKTNTTYTFTLTKNVPQEGIVDIDFFWYEHTSG